MATVGFLVQLPLALPPLASGILLLFLVGYSSPIGRLTAGALTNSFAGIVIAQVFVAAPFLIIAARSSFAAIDPVLEGVAATLGRRPLYVFFRVSVPIAWPAILSGLLLAWLRAFGEFGATVMVAYHPYSLPVYTYVAFGAQGLPAMLPVLVPAVVLALAIMVFSGFAGAQAERRRFLSPSVEDLPGAAREPPARPAAKPEPIDMALKLEKRLGSFRLDIQWSPQRRRLAILGPSGSGKSLTLKLIAGIESCDRGTIMVEGRVISSLAPAARGVAYVPQNYGLFPHLTVIEQLSFPLGLRSGSGSGLARPPRASRPRAAAPGRALARPAATGGAGARVGAAGTISCCSTNRFRRSMRRCAQISARKCWRCRTRSPQHDPRHPRSGRSSPARRRDRRS